MLFADQARHMDALSRLLLEDRSKADDETEIL